MPSLPRIRRSRARRGSPAISPAPVVHELTASGLTWVNVVSPDVETARSSRSASAGTHSTSRTSSRSASVRRSTTTRTRATCSPSSTFPIYDTGYSGSMPRSSTSSSGTTTSSRSRTGSSGRSPGCSRAARRTTSFGISSSHAAPAASCRARRPLRLLLPDPRQDRPQARRDRGRDVRRQGSQEVVRDISNVKQEIISYRKIIKPERSTLRMLERRVESLPPRGARGVLRRHRRLRRAHLGPARQLQGGRRSARVDERVGARTSLQRRPPHPHRL